MSSGPFGFVGSGSADDDLVPIDLTTGTALAVLDLPGGNYPYDATIRPGGAEVWVANNSGDAVTVVDIATQTVIGTPISLVGTAEYPVDVAFSVDGSIAYVSSRDSEVVARIDANTKTVLGADPLPGAIDGGKMAVDPCSGTVYLVDWYDDTLLTYNPIAGTFTEDANVGSSLWDLVIDSTGETLYITDRSTDVVVVYDVATQTIVTTVPAGLNPWGIAITPDDAWLVVASLDSASVTFIDTATLTPTTLLLPSAAAPRDVEIDATGQYAYLPSGNIPGNDALYVIDIATQTLVDTIDLGVSFNANVVAISEPFACSLAP